MSLEANKAVVRRAIEALNKQDLSLLDDLVAPNYYDHTGTQGDQLWAPALAVYATKEREIEPHILITR